MIRILINIFFYNFGVWKKKHIIYLLQNVLISAKRTLEIPFFKANLHLMPSGPIVF